MDFKEKFKTTLRIIVPGIKYSIQKETAYVANNIGNTFSTFFYTLALVLFIDIIYTNTDNFANYSKDEMLIFTVVGQAGFYALFIFYNLYSNFDNIVRRGQLDMILVKPIPIVPYLYVTQMNLIQSLRDGVIPILLICTKIEFTHVNITIGSFIWFLIIFLAGLIIANCIHFLGASSSLITKASNKLFWTIHLVFFKSSNKIPFEGYKKIFGKVIHLFFPVFLLTGISSSVLLNKVNGCVYTFLSIIICIATVIVSNIVFNTWLKKYSSASS